MNEAPIRPDDRPETVTETANMSAGDPEVIRPRLDDKEPTIREYLARPRHESGCARCGQDEKATQDIYVCGHCTAYLAELWKHRTKSRRKTRLCDCGEPLTARQRHCQACAKRRRRETYRASKRRVRS